MVAECQPSISPNLFSFLEEAVTNVENRLPALVRSVQEIKEDWG